MQQDTPASYYRNTRVLQPAPDKVTQHGAEAETFIVARKKEVSKKIHGAHSTRSRARPP